MTHAERLLLGPGPSNPFPEVMEAFQRPVLGHLDPDFLVVLDEIGDRLRVAFRTANTLTLPMSGTGSAGMETCFVNLVEPGDTVIIGVNGVFGERMCEVARRCGAEVVRVEAPWGRAIDPQRMLDAHREHPGARVLAISWWNSAILPSASGSSSLAAAGIRQGEVGKACSGRAGPPPSSRPCPAGPPSWRCRSAPGKRRWCRGAAGRPGERRRPRMRTRPSSSSTLSELWLVCMLRICSISARVTGWW